MNRLSLHSDARQPSFFFQSHTAGFAAGVCECCAVVCTGTVAG